MVKTLRGLVYDYPEGSKASQSARRPRQTRLHLLRNPPDPRLLHSKGETTEVSIGPRLLVNDFDLLRQAIIAGLGIGLLPEPDCIQAIQDGDLKRILPA